MKEYRLKSWTELPAPFQGMSYRRMLTDLSHRYMSVTQLVTCSGARRQDVCQFLDSLNERGVLAERELFTSESSTPLDSVRPFGAWVRRKLNRNRDDR